MVFLDFGGVLGSGWVSRLSRTLSGQGDYRIKRPVGGLCFVVSGAPGYDHSRPQLEKDFEKGCNSSGFRLR